MEIWIVRWCHSEEKLPKGFESGDDARVSGTRTFPVNAVNIVWHEEYESSIDGNTTSQPCLASEVPSRCCISVIGLVLLDLSKSMLHASLITEKFAM